MHIEADSVSEGYCCDPGGDCSVIRSRSLRCNAEGKIKKNIEIEALFLFFEMNYITMMIKVGFHIHVNHRYGRM